MIKFIAIGLLVIIFIYAIYLLGYAHGNKDGQRGINKHPDTQERWF